MQDRASPAPLRKVVVMAHLASETSGVTTALPPARKNFVFSAWLYRSGTEMSPSVIHLQGRRDSGAIVEEYVPSEDS
jgi:hypothetical protein